MDDKKINELIERIVEKEVNSALKNSGIVERILSELAEDIMSSVERKVLDEIAAKDIDMDYFHFCSGLLESGSQCRYSD
jgi:predicted transcriptional regulator